MCVGQVNTSQNTGESRYWQRVSHGEVCLFVVSLSTMQGRVAVHKGEPKSRKVLSCLRFLSLSFPAVSVHQGVLVLLRDICFHLFSFLFLLTQTLQPTLVLILTLEYTLILFHSCECVFFLMLLLELSLWLS